VDWWQRTPWGDRDRVGVRLAWVPALGTFLLVVFLLVDQVF
jgi:hypothetical protein